MSTALDAVFPALAENLLASFGTDIAIQRRTGGTADPATRALTGTSTSTMTIKCSPPSPFSKREIDGTRILGGDLQTVVAANDCTFAPAIDQTATFGGRAWRIVNVETIRSGDSIAAYQLQLRASQ